MLTEVQKRTAQCIVNIFETGSARGDYAAVTLLPGDAGHLTYGRSQTTLGSGNLHTLIADYVNAPGARFASELSVYLSDTPMRAGDRIHVPGSDAQAILDELDLGHELAKLERAWILQASDLPPAWSSGG